MRGFPGSGGVPCFPKLWVSANTSISQKRFNLVTKLNSNELWFGPLFSHSYGLLVWHYSTLLIFLSHRGLQPVWEFQTLTNLVERAPVLLGLVLVCLGEKFADFQVLILGKSCGWCLGCVPLGVSSGFRSISKTISNSVANSTNRRHRWNSYGIYWAKLRHPKSSVVFCPPQPPQAVRQRLESWASKSQLFSEIAQTEKRSSSWSKTNRYTPGFGEMRLNPSLSFGSGIVFSVFVRPVSCCQKSADKRCEPGSKELTNRSKIFLLQPRRNFL